MSHRVVVEIEVEVPFSVPKGAKVLKIAGIWADPEAFPVNPPYTYVLAGNSRQFGYYVAGRPGQYIYVNTPDKLMGVVKPKIVTTGTWWENDAVARFISEQGLWGNVNGGGR